ncbi:MAG: aldehyde dehydrogenase family protein [Candidatus Neomarinimicrobiota bacterium]
MDKDLLGQQEVRDLCEQADAAQREIAGFSQQQVDRICAAMARAGFRAARRLAELAVEETGMGRVEDKVLKNEFSTRDVWEANKDVRTVGVIGHDRLGKHTIYAEPMGVVTAIIPTTNPTSTAMYKAIICVKSRNAMVASPHPSAGRCTLEAIKVVAEAAESAGAPKGLLSCLSLPGIKATVTLMKDERVKIILSTGGTSIVRAAHSSGKPAIGVGPGNVPAFIEKSADIRKAVRDIITGKSFDWGVICSSEQAMIVDRRIEKKVLDCLKREPVVWIKGEERTKLETLMIDTAGHLNTAVVGQSPARIAQLAGFTIPEETEVLLVEQEGVGPEYPLSREKLSPVLAYYTVADADAGIILSARVVEYGGLGHTAVIHSRDEAVVERFAGRVKAFRVLVNTTGPHGSVGYTTSLDPALTLGCGTWGGAITGDNITPLHLINRKHLAWETTPVSVDEQSEEFHSRRGNYSRFDDLHLPAKGGSEETSVKSEPAENDLDFSEVDRLAREFSQKLRTE